MDSFLLHFDQEYHDRGQSIAEIQLYYDHLFL